MKAVTDYADGTDFLRPKLIGANRPNPNHPWSQRDIATTKACRGNRHAVFGWRLESMKTQPREPQRPQRPMSFVPSAFSAVVFRKTTDCHDGRWRVYERCRYWGERFWRFLGHHPLPELRILHRIYQFA